MNSGSHRGVSTAALLFVLAACSAASAQVSFHVIEIPPGERATEVRGLSGDGRFAVGDVGRVPHRPMRWSDGEIEYLPLLQPGASSLAHAASRDGSIIVGTSMAGGRSTAVRWTAQGVEALSGVPAESESHAYDVSADGRVIVGSERSPNGPDNAYRWTQEGGYQVIGPGSASGVSADGATIVGHSFSVAGGAFRWTEGTGMMSLGPFPMGWDSAAPAAVSGDGSTSVGSLHFGSAPVSQATRWTEATGYQPLPNVTPVIRLSFARDVSADGRTVVGTTVADGGGASIWFADGTGQLMSEYLESLGLDLGDLDLAWAEAISDDGLTIAGWAFDTQRRTVGWVAHVPTPGAGLVLVLGCIQMARRRRAHAPI
jgi:uncharacterized membrane protein